MAFLLCRRGESLFNRSLFSSSSFTKSSVPHFSPQSRWTKEQHLPKYLQVTQTVQSFTTSSLSSPLLLLGRKTHQFSLIGTQSTHKRSYSTENDEYAAYRGIFVRHLVTRVEKRKREQIQGTILVFGAMFALPLLFLAFSARREEVPYTKRRQWLFTREEDEIKLGQAAYAQVLNQYKDKILPPNHRVSISNFFVSFSFTLLTPKHSQAVQRVGRRIVKASGDEKLKRLRWEFTVIDSPEANAFVLPGGKVVVFTGILKILRNEAGMATVLAHEIAHVIARHGAEQMGLQYMLFFLLSRFSGRFLRSAVGSLLATKFSRSRESEADHIGLLLMSRACYNPHEAVQMWERFQNESPSMGSGLLLQFLSTHPPHSQRIVQISGWVPDAVKLAKESDCRRKLQQLMERRKGTSKPVSIAELYPDFELNRETSSSYPEPSVEPYEEEYEDDGSDDL